MKIKKISYKSFGFCLLRVSGLRFFAFIFLVGLIFSCGCAVVHVLTTPTSHEKKVEAEYLLNRAEDQRVLVLVDQPMWLSSKVNLRFYLTQAMNAIIIGKAEVLPENVIPYKELSELRSDTELFSQLTPTQVGSKLDVDMVLMVVVSEYELTELADSGYYKGNLTVKAALFDVATEAKLWPDEGEAQTVKVGFDMGPSDKQKAINRLAIAAAHCTVRYLYDCSEASFKIFDDRSPSEVDKWDTN